MLVIACGQVSRLMVTEIRRRASDKGTEEASLAITDYLLVQESEEGSRGWVLLNTLWLLSSGGQVRHKLVVVCVMCLYVNCTPSHENLLKFL